MPPRVDLHAFGAIAMVDFSPPDPNGSNLQAGREFLAVVQSAQPGVPILELGDRNRVLADVGHGVLEADAIRAIGARHRVDALVVGNFEARQVRPSFRLGAFAESVSASAQVDGALTVRIYDTHTGATLWSTAAHGRESIANMTVANGDLAGVGATDPRAAEARLARGLVHEATHDFWPYWVRQ